MKKVIVEFGFESRGGEFVVSEKEMEFENERDFIKECLLEEFDSEVECIEFWKGYCNVSNINNMEDVVDEIVFLKRFDESVGGEFGYLSSEEGFFRIKS